MRIVVVDDDAAMRHYITEILKPAQGFGVVGSFSSAVEALIGIPPLRPDVVLMDIRMPGMDGIECTIRLKRAIPQVKIVIVTGLYGTPAVNASSRAYVDGFLTKPITVNQCRATIRFLCLSKTEPRQEMQILEPKMRSPKPSGDSSRLSPRDTEVLKGLADGLLYKEIADKLGISYGAVHKHQHKIFQRLHVSNRSEAIRMWMGGAGR